MIDDEKILVLFFERSEQGIRELDIKYGKQSHKLSYVISSLPPFPVFGCTCCMVSASCNCNHKEEHHENNPIQVFHTSHLFPLKLR